MCGRAAQQVDETLRVPRTTFSDVSVAAGQAGGLSVSSVPCPRGEPALSRIRQAGLRPSQEGVGSSFTMASGLSQSRHRGAPSQHPPDRRAVGRNGGPCSSLGQPRPGLRGSARWGGPGRGHRRSGRPVCEHPPPIAPGAAGLGWWLVPRSVPRSIPTAEDGWGPGTLTALDPQENPGASHLQGPPGGLSRDPGAGSGCSGLGPAGPGSAARGQGVASQADRWGLRSACHPTRVSGVHADDVHATHIRSFWVLQGPAGSRIIRARSRRLLGLRL